MAEITYKGKSFEVDEDGFLLRFDDLVADLFCPVCVRPAVLLVDSFMTDKEFSLTLCCRSCRKNLSAESKFVTPHC